MNDAIAAIGSATAPSLEQFGRGGRPTPAAAHDAEPVMRSRGFSAQRGERPDVLDVRRFQNLSPPISEWNIARVSSSSSCALWLERERARPARSTQCLSRDIRGAFGDTNAPGPLRRAR